MDLSLLKFSSASAFHSYRTKQMTPGVHWMNKYCFMGAFCLLSTSVFADIRPCGGAPGGFRANPDASMGGFVASSAVVSVESVLGTETQVCDFAVLKGAVKLQDKAMVSGRASLSGNIELSGNANVYGDANLVNSDVGADMLVQDDAKVYGNALLDGTLVIAGTSEIFGHARVQDFAEVWGASRVCANSLVDGHTVLTDSTIHCPNK